MLGFISVHKFIFSYLNDIALGGGRGTRQRRGGRNGTQIHLKFVHNINFVQLSN